MSDYNPVTDDKERYTLIKKYKNTKNKPFLHKFKECVIIVDDHDEYCYFHECGPTDPEQCGKEECPHCVVKTVKDGKLKLTNSYLKSKDAGEIA